MFWILREALPRDLLYSTFTVKSQAMVINTPHLGCRESDHKVFNGSAGEKSKRAAIGGKIEVSLNAAFCLLRIVWDGSYNPIIM